MPARRGLWHGWAGGLALAGAGAAVGGQADPDSSRVVNGYHVPLIEFTLSLPSGHMPPGPAK